MSTNKEKYLVLRGKNKDIYFIQKRLSKVQSKIIGKNFIKKSLETTDLEEAIIKRDEILSDLNKITLSKVEESVQDENDKIFENPIKDDFKLNNEEISEREHNSVNIDEELDESEDKKDNVIKVNVPMISDPHNSSYGYKEDERYTIFSLKLPKFPEKDDIVIKIDKIVPIVIVIFTLFIAFIA